MLSRQDLHPKHGARFVFTREGEDDPRYRVEVYLPQARLLQTQLSWDDEGKPQVVPGLDDDAVVEQLYKLARVLKRSPKARLTRWRELSS